jgi:hypothetical protein
LLQACCGGPSTAERLACAGVTRPPLGATHQRGKSEISDLKFQISDLKKLNTENLDLMRGI